MSEHKHSEAGLQGFRNLGRKQSRKQIEKAIKWLARNDIDPTPPQPMHMTSQMYKDGQVVEVSRGWRRGRR